MMFVNRLTMRFLISLGLAALVIVGSAAAAGRDLAVIDAVRNADGEELRALLRKKADVNVAEADGTTALHWASYADDLETVDLLIRAGALVNAANDLGVTPLWTASLNGSAAIVRRLLAAGANPNAALLLGETPVMVAARSGNVEVVEMLLAKGANANARAARGQTALMWAVAQKHSSVVKALIGHGADVHARSDVWSQVMAVPPHGLPEYNRAIPHGADPDARLQTWTPTRRSSKDFHFGPELVGATPFWLAARFSEPAVMRLLVEYGADPLFVHHVDYRRDEGAAERRSEATTALM